MTEMQIEDTRSDQDGKLLFVEAAMPHPGLR
jgi:hypothetical protein